ncbi:MAG: hypothetical protein Kow0092_37230 [Deferrisomatales bacterium]
MSVFLVVSFAFAVVASVIAYSKGRNSLGWFLAGLFIGPFALVVAVLPPVARAGQFVHCPECAEVIRAGARRCRYCGEALRPLREVKEVRRSA